MEKDHYFHPYSSGIKAVECELLPTYHEVSVYPQKEVPFFITFTAALGCIITVLAVFTRAYPDLLTQLSGTVSNDPLLVYEFVQILLT